MPEHCSSLQEHTAVRQWTEDHRRPHLDEQFQEQLQQVLVQALANQQTLKITVLSSSGYRTYSGVPLRSDPATGLIYLHAGKGRPQTIKAAEVVGIEPY